MNQEPQFQRPEVCDQIIRDLAKRRSQRIGTRYDTMTLVALWERLGDIPVSDDGCIEEDFLHFQAGADREDVWHWFEEQNPAFIVGEVQQGRPPA